MVITGRPRPCSGLALVVALAAACGSRDAVQSWSDAAIAPPLDGRTVDRRDDTRRFSAQTRWAPCGMLEGEPEYNHALAVSPDGRYLAASGERGWVWDLREGRVIHKFATDGGIKPWFSPGSTLISLAGDGRSVFRISDGALVATIPHGVDGCLTWSSAATFSADNKAVALGNCSSVEIHALGGDRVRQLGSQVWSPGVAYSPDGRWLATSGPELWRADGEERMWPDDLVTGPSYTSLFDGFDRFNDNTVVFSPDGNTLLVSNAASTRATPEFTVSTQLLRVTDGAVVRDFGATLPRRPTFSPDGAWISAGAQVVHLATDQRATLDASIELSTFLPDGRIAAAATDARIRLFCPH